MLAAIEKRPCRRGRGRWWLATRSQSIRHGRMAAVSNHRRWWRSLHCG